MHPLCPSKNNVLQKETDNGSSEDTDEDEAGESLDVREESLDNLPFQLEECKGMVLRMVRVSQLA